MKKLLSILAVSLLAGSAWAAQYQFTPDAVTTVANISTTGVAIGKGKTPATAALDIVGNVKVSGSITAGGLGGSVSTSSIVGIMPAAKGGTGADMSAAAVGAVPYFSGTGVQAALGAGSSGEVLKSNGAGAPSWEAQSSLSVGNATNAGTCTNLSGGSVSATGVTISGTGPLIYGSKTIAQLTTDTPTSVGMGWWCSDCVNTTVAVSTGTLPGEVSDIKDKTASIQ